MTKTRVFLSYARADDDPNYDDASKSFMRRLYKFLDAAGFDVWWDRVSLPSRGEEFTKEIEEAIRPCDRFVLVVGPGAVASDYVRAEWRFALSLCKPITVILRAGEYDLIPGDVKGFSGVNAIDCRPSRDENLSLFDLAKRLNEDAPIGQTFGVKPLPKAHITREGVYDEAFKALKADAIQTTVISAPEKKTPDQSAVAVYGMGGIGKSTLAAALAHDCHIRRHYYDGVVWLEVGQTPTVASLQAALGGHFGDDRQNYTDEQNGVLLLSKLLKTKRALVVLDDVWDPQIVAKFPVHGTGCRLLITTRSGKLARDVQGADIKLNALTPDEGARLMAERTGGDPTDPNLRAISDFLDGYTLAVALAAAQIAGGYADSPDDMLRLLKKRAETEPFKDLAVDENEKDENLALSLSLSYGALKTDDLRRRFRALGVFALDGTFDRTALAGVWGDADEDDTRAPLKALEGAGLLEPAEGADRYNQHRVLRAYARALLTEAGELDDAQRHHFEFYERFHIKGRDNTDPDYLMSITPDLENLREALMWGFNHEPERACDLLTVHLGNYYLNYQSVSYRPLLETALSAAQQIGYPQGQANTLRALGDLVARENDLVAAHEAYGQALPIYETIGDQLGQANTLQSIGDLAVREAELASAREAYKRAHSIYEVIGDWLGQANVLFELGNVSLRETDLVAAREAYRQALHIFNSIGERLGQAGTLLALGDLAMREADLAAARTAYGQALPIYEAIGVRRGEANTLQALGNLSLREGNLPIAHDCYRRALTMFETIGDRLGQANTLQAIGDLGLWEADLAAAHEAYGRALTIYEAIGEPVGLMNTHVEMGRMYRNRGDIAQAKIHFQKWLAILDQTPAYQNHPFYLQIRREYQALMGESAPQPSLDDALRQLKPVYDEIGADALREALIGQGLPAETVEDILAKLAAM